MQVVAGSRRRRVWGGRRGAAGAVIDMVVDVLMQLTF